MVNHKNGQNQKVRTEVEIINNIKAFRNSKGFFYTIRFPKISNERSIPSRTAIFGKFPQTSNPKF